MAGLWPASMEGNGENAMILQTSCRKLRDYSKSQCKSSFRVRLAVVFMRIMRCCEVGCGNCTDTLMLCRSPSWSTCRWDLWIWMIWFHSYWTEFMIWKQLVESVCDISRFLVLQCVKWGGDKSDCWRHAPALSEITWRIMAQEIRRTADQVESSHQVQENRSTTSD